MKAQFDEYLKASNRRDSEFKGNVGRIVEAVKNQIPIFIYISKTLAEESTDQERATIALMIEEVKQAITTNEKLIEQYPDEELKKNNQELREIETTTFYDKGFSPEGLRKRINNSFAIYLDFLAKKSPKAYAEVQAFIEEAIKNRDKIDPSNMDISNIVPEAIVCTKYPMNFLTPTDKVSNLAFCGELNGEQRQQLAMERRGSKKQITTMASINFDDLNGSVQINKGRKELTAYDREVHDAIITLYVDGQNEYITPQMIYQVMTGNPNATLKSKQAEAISDSITKCLYSRVTIDASEEAKAFGFDSFKYDGALISGERVTATLNGKVLECLRILRSPVLYEYANKKSQIGRFDIKLLNSPLNKTEEIITLQGYLYRRILSMRGSSNLSKTIVYGTVYDQIGVSAASQGALRKKKTKLRNQIKTILDFWKEKGFILNYSENKRGQEAYSVTIEFNGRGEKR